MDRERLDDWCERGILGLVLAILIFTPLATGAVRAQDFAVVEWLTLGVLVVWLARFWINPKHRLLWPPVCWAVLPFIAYSVFRYGNADLEWVARQELIKILVYAILFYAVVHNLHKQEFTQIVGLTLIFLAMTISLYAVYQFLAETNSVWHFLKPEGYRNRGSGTFICPNNLAGYLEMILPLSLTYTLTGRFNYLTKVFLAYASMVIFAGIAVTVSRGGWIACGVSLVVLFLWLIRTRDYRLQGVLVLAGLLLIAGTVVAKIEITPKRQTRLTEAGAIEDVRFQIWEPAREMWKEHLWTGVGPAHFDYRFRQYRAPTPDLQVRPERVHNDYLNTLADWGLIGAILVAAPWALFYVGVFRSWKFVARSKNDLNSKRSNKSSFVMGGALGLLAILVHSFVDFNMHIPANALVVVTLLALVTGHFRFASEGYWHTLRGPMRGVVTAVLLAPLVYLAPQAWKRTAETHWQAVAERLPAYTAEHAAALKRAFAAEGQNFEIAYDIGEDYRMQSWAGGEDHEALAKEAMQWFQKSMDLNPFDPYSRVRYGMCLHWIKRHADAEPYFKKATELDPNGYYTQANVGWHYFQLEDYANAKKFLEKSLQLKWSGNTIAHSYLKFTEQKLAEAARLK